MNAERRNENERIKKDKKKARETRRLKDNQSVIVEFRHLADKIKTAKYFFGTGLNIQKESSDSNNIILFN